MESVRAVAIGTVMEFAVPSLSSYPWGIVAGPDGNGWVAEEGANKIGRVALDGSMTEFALPTAASYPYNIAAGPDSPNRIPTSLVASRSMARSPNSPCPCPVADLRASLPGQMALSGSQS